MEDIGGYERLIACALCHVVPWGGYNWPRRTWRVESFGKSGHLGVMFDSLTFPTKTLLQSLVPFAPEAKYNSLQFGIPQVPSREGMSF